MERVSKKVINPVKRAGVDQSASRQVLSKNENGYKLAPTKVVKKKLGKGPFAQSSAVGEPDGPFTPRFGEQNEINGVPAQPNIVIPAQPEKVMRVGP